MRLHSRAPVDLFTCAGTTISADFSKASLSVSVVGSFRRVWRALQSVAADVCNYLVAWNEAFTAAALYEELSQLSDAQLERRGIARGDLSRHIADQITRK